MAMDKIILKRLEIRCIVGIYPRERVKKQRVWIDLEIPCDVRRAARRDRIEDTTDYKRIAKAVLDFVSKSKFHLIETLAERVAELVLSLGVRSVKLTVWKPGAIRFSENVGIQIQRPRAS